jgi:hypothetical protein
MTTSRSSSLCHRLLFLLCIVSMIVFANGDVNATPVSGDEFRDRLNLPQDPTITLDEILSRDEFKNHEESWVVNAKKWLWTTFLKALKWVLERLPSFELPDIDRNVGQLILDAQMVAVLVIIVALAGWVIARLHSRRRARVRIVQPDAESAEPEFLGSEEALTMALRMGEQGKYRDGLIYLFRYVLLWLDETGRLTLGPGKTNREVVSSISSDDPLKDLLTEMVPVFNRVRYGNAPCGEFDYQRFKNLCLRVMERE